MVNGNFNLGNSGWTSEPTRREDGAGAQDGEVSVRESPNTYVTNSCKHGMCLDGNAGGAVWQQELEVEAGTEYSFTAFFAVRTDGSATSRLLLRVDGTPITGVFDGASGAPAPWIPFGGTFTTGPEQTSALVEVYNEYLGGAGNGFVLDEIAVVKKPSVCALPSDEPDAGESEADAGEVEADAGESTPDAGETSADAGETTPDAGGETPDPEPVGCACGAGNVGALVLLPLAGLLRRRSRRSSRE